MRIRGALLHSRLPHVFILLQDFFPVLLPLVVSLILHCCMSDVPPRSKQVQNGEKTLKQKEHTGRENGNAEKASVGIRISKSCTLSAREMYVLEGEIYIFTALGALLWINMLNCE